MADKKKKKSKNTVPGREIPDTGREIPGCEIPSREIPGREIPGLLDCYRYLLSKTNRAGFYQNVCDPIGSAHRRRQSFVAAYPSLSTLG